MYLSPLELDDLILHILYFLPFDHIRTNTCLVNQQFYRVSTHASLLRDHVLNHLFPHRASNSDAVSKGQELVDIAKQQEQQQQQEDEGKECHLRQEYYHSGEFWENCYHMLRLPYSRFDSSISDRYAPDSVRFETNDHMFSLVTGGNITGFGKFRFYLQEIQGQRINNVIPFHYFEVSVEEKVLGYNLSIGVSNSQFEATDNYTGYSSDNSDIYSRSVGYSSDGHIRYNAQSLQDGVVKTSFRDSGNKVGVLMNFMPGDESISFFLNGELQHKHVIEDVREFFAVDKRHTTNWVGEEEPYVTASCTVNSCQDKLKFVTRGFSVPFDTYIAPLVIKYMQEKEGTDNVYE